MMSYIISPHCSTKYIYMWPIVTDRVAWSVCWSVTVVSPAETAAPIEMPFGLLALMRQIPHRKREFSGERSAHCKVWALSAVSCAKTAEVIDLPFGLWTRVDKRKHVLDGSRSPCERGNYKGKDMPGHVRRRSAVSCAKCLNRSIRHLGWGLRWPKEAPVQLYSPGGRYWWCRPNIHRPTVIF